MKKKQKHFKEPESEFDDIPRIRQVQILGLNESLNLISNYPHETMEYLSSKAMRMYRKIKSDK